MSASTTSEQTPTPNPVLPPLESIVQEALKDVQNVSVANTLASLASMGVTKTSDLSMFLPQDLEDIIKPIPPVPRSKLREALAKCIKQAPPPTSLGAGTNTVPTIMIKFWEGLRALTIPINAMILSLEEGTYFVGNQVSGSKMFVRRAYTDLFQIIEQKIAQGFNKALIVGNPGIGKSWFLYYVMWCLVKKHVPIVLESCAYSPNWYMFLPDGSVQKGNTSNRPQQLDDPNAWYLVDTTQPCLCAAKTIMVSSPYKGHFKYYVKYEGSFIRYMPVWTEEEILLCRKEIYPNLPEEEVRGRFLKWGGIPRYVLEKVDAPHQNTLIAALDAANLDSIVKYIGQSDTPDDASHKLVHMIVQVIILFPFPPFLYKLIFIFFIW